MIVDVVEIISYYETIFLKFASLLLQAADARLSLTYLQRIYEPPKPASQDI